MIKPRRIKNLFSSGGLLSFREASVAPVEEVSVRSRQDVSDRRLSDEMTLTDEVARIVTSDLEIEQVYQQFFQALRNVVDYDRGGLTLLDTGGETYSFRHLVLDAPSIRRAGDQVSQDDSYTGEVLSSGRSIVVGTIPEDSDFPNDQACLRIGVRSILVVPLVLDGSIAGTIAIASRQEGAYGSKEQALFERLAKQLAPTMAKARLNEEKEKDEQSLRASEKWFRTLVEQAADPIYLVDFDGRFLDVNEAARPVCWQPAKVGHFC